jgi:outer membrane protein OmpA-like peptidoglycan-associated protein
MMMKAALTTIVCSTVIAAGLVVACARRPIVRPPEPQDLFVLLPDPDDNTAGRVTVSNQGGAVDLSGAWQATEVGLNRAPKPAATMDQAEVERMFRGVLSALPLPPRHFTLYFQSGSDQLTNESRALTAEILRVVKARPNPDVIVVGHTDTVGSAASNEELGLKRATIVRNLLVAAGLDAAAVEVTSHGEGDPLIKTPDETDEPRNRRVEIDIQ